MSATEQVVGPHQNAARFLYQHDRLFLLYVVVPGLCLAYASLSTDPQIATSGVNIITDFWIIALPIKTLNGYKRPLKERIALALIFGAGIFAAIMSVVRLQSIYTYTLATDPFRDAIAVSIAFYSFSCLLDKLKADWTRLHR